jgi:hypothetical protein
VLPGTRKFSDDDIVHVLSEALDVYAKVTENYDLDENERMVVLQTAIAMVGKREITGTQAQILSQVAGMESLT